jgi:hypothetical protein
MARPRLRRLKSALKALEGEFNRPVWSFKIQLPAEDVAPNDQTMEPRVLDIKGLGESESLKSAGGYSNWLLGSLGEKRRRRAEHQRFAKERLEKVLGELRGDNDGPSPGISLSAPHDLSLQLEPSDSIRRQKAAIP